MRTRRSGAAMSSCQLVAVLLVSISILVLSVSRLRPTARPPGRHIAGAAADTMSPGWQPESAILRADTISGCAGGGGLHMCEGLLTAEFLRHADVQPDLPALCCAVRRVLALSDSCAAVLLFQTVNGLGNRFRGIFSLLQSLSLRPLGAPPTCVLLLWPVDSHCNASLAMLVDSRFASFGVSVATSSRVPAFTDVVTDCGSSMTCALAGAPPPSMDTQPPVRYVRTSSASLAHPPAAVDLLRTFSPVPAVKALASSMLARGIRLGMHVRTIHPSVESAKGIHMGSVPAAELDLLNAKREADSVARLLSSVRQRISTGSGVFVAIDNSTVLDIPPLSDLPLVRSPVQCVDRTPLCIQAAFAEMIVLSKVPAFVGSRFSSFSEVICLQRMAEGFGHNCEFL